MKTSKSISSRSFKSRRLTLDERGVTLQTLIVTGVLVLAMVGAGIIIYNVANRSTEDTNKVETAEPERAAADEVIVTQSTSTTVDSAVDNEDENPPVSPADNAELDATPTSLDSLSETTATTTVQVPATRVAPAPQAPAPQVPAPQVPAAQTPTTATTQAPATTTTAQAPTTTITTTTQAPATTTTTQAPPQGIPLDEYNLTNRPQGNALHISTGESHSCAVVVGTRVKCWGRNREGQLGNGQFVDSNTPVEVTDLYNTKEVSAGQSHTCALAKDRTVRCWGLGDSGRLGNGSDSSSATPIKIALSGVTQLSVGSNHSCALVIDEVKCWGDNSSGQIGDIAESFVSTPTTVPGLSGVTQIASGNFHSCVIVENGAVKCWGQGFAGQLGDGNIGMSSTPVDVVDIDGSTAEKRAIKVSAGGFNSCAVLTTGFIKCWGEGGFGQLGNGGRSSNIPVEADLIDNLGTQTADISISTSLTHSCAVSLTGAVKCWGANTFGQLGNGGTTDALTPVTTLQISNALQVSTSVNHTCALLADGNVACWGFNNFGELGDRTEIQRNAPVLVQFG